VSPFGRRAACDSTSKRDTAARGRPEASQRPFAAANPARTPVNDPGPLTTPMAFRSSRCQLISCKRRRTAERISAEALPRARSSEANTCFPVLRAIPAVSPQVSISSSRIFSVSGVSTLRAYRASRPARRNDYSTEARTSSRTSSSWAASPMVFGKATSRTSSIREA
jgi:hypothetical protein